jgi:signal recognition particle subunit SRP54
MLETINRGFTTLKNKIQGLEVLTEEKIDEVLGDVRRSLLEADVALPVVKKFLSRVKEKALGEIVRVRVEHKERKLKISPSQAFIKICEEELVALLGPVDTSLLFRTAGPSVVMLVGLQGSGKTTTAGKLASFIQRKYQKRSLLVAADVYRPAAIDQLKVIGGQLDMPVYSREMANPVAICQEAVEEAKRLQRDVVILDTAGRLAIDEQLMEELESIKRQVRPDNIFLVCDAMIGQDAVRMSTEFDRRLNVDGFIMTKLDGDTRGGSTLSVKEVTGKPVKFVGMGEALDRLEEFRPDGLASRILGFGDIVGLVKDFESVVDEKKAEEDAARMLQGDFTLTDYLEQIQTLRKMGPLSEVMEKVPGMSDAFPDGMQFDESHLTRTVAMINSMTPEERARPQVINQSRASRIARGSGRKPHEVRNLVAQFMAMKKMMSRFSESSGLMGRIPGLKKLDQMSQMRKLMSEGVDEQGMEGLLSGMKNPFKKKFQPEFSSKNLNEDEWTKLKNKRKAQRKARKSQKKRKK